MVICFVLINSELGAEEEILAKLKKIQGVRESFPVYGVYDIVAKVESPTMEELDALVNSIRRIDKIRSTITMVAMSEKETLGFKR